MRIYVVHPGASFSTHDVYMGVVEGLRANGHDVLEGRLDTILTWYQAASAAGVQAGTFSRDVLSADPRNPSAMASAHITRHILLTQPDWVVVVSCHNYNTHDVMALRRHGYRTAVLLTESPYFGDTETQIARCFDVVYTNERRAVDGLCDAGCERVHYLPHAYRTGVHTPDGPRGAPVDVAFVGTLFDERRPLIKALIDAGLSVSVRGYDLGSGVVDIVDNEAAAAMYRGAKICLNHHRTTRHHGSGEHIAVDEAESLGPRAYEIAACGGFQLVDDRRAEVFSLFGNAAATYDPTDSRDLVRQCRTWLADDAHRAHIAAQQHAAVQGHDWTARAAQLVASLEVR